MNSTLILSQQKALADPSILTFPGSRQVAFHDCNEISLTGYTVSGNAGALPSHLLVDIPHLTGNQIIHVCDGNGAKTTMRKDAAFVIYPPGGVQTQGRTNATVKFTDGAVSLENKPITLLEPNGAGGYQAFTDYTHVLLELQLRSHQTKFPRFAGEGILPNPRENVGFREAMEHLMAGISPDAGIDAPRAP